MTKFISIDKDTKEKKETVFTHVKDINGWLFTTLYKPKDFKEVIYVGKCKFDGDMFACKKDGYIEIFKGTKGDEFN